MAFYTAKTKKTSNGYQISWDGNDVNEVEIYASADNAFQPTKENYVTKVIGGQCEVSVDFTPRAYFILKAQDGSMIRTAVRIITTEGIKNFRDLGGYQTQDGRWVKWGLLYRSAAHDQASDNDLNLLKQLGIKSVVDYRSSREFKEAPDKKAEGVVYLSNPPFPENAGAADVLHFDTKSEEKAVFGMLECNRVLATAEDSFKAYHALFQNALNDEMVPTIQHCTAGKDRVGVGACCTLLALGVDEKTVMEDYLLSNADKLPIEKLTAAMNKQGKQVPMEQIKAIDALLGVREEYLQQFLTIIKSKYATFEEFLLKDLGLKKEEIERFRDKYLEVL